jgi:hypothetical protein
MEKTPVMTLDKPFYTVPELVAIIRSHGHKVPAIYPEIRLGNLKATKRRSAATGHICKVVAQIEVERYLKRLGIASTIAAPEEHAHLRNPLRNVALVAVREFLATVPNRNAEDEALSLISDALPSKAISVALERTYRTLPPERIDNDWPKRRSKGKRKAA